MHSHLNEADVWVWASSGCFHELVLGYTGCPVTTRVKPTQHMDTDTTKRQSICNTPLSTLAAWCLSSVPPKRFWLLKCLPSQVSSSSQAWIPPLCASLRCFWMCGWWHSCHWALTSAAVSFQFPWLEASAHTPVCLSFSQRKLQSLAMPHQKCVSCPLCLAYCDFYLFVCREERCWMHLCRWDDLVRQRQKERSPAPALLYPLPPSLHLRQMISFARLEPWHIDHSLCETRCVTPLARAPLCHRVQ